MEKQKKKPDNEGSYGSLTVGELKEIIKDVPDDTEIHIRTCHNPTGNICKAGNIEQSEYGFFGTSIPCMIIEPSLIGYIIDPEKRDERVKLVESIHGECHWMDY